MVVTKNFTEIRINTSNKIDFPKYSPKCHRIVNNRQTLANKRLLLDSSFSCS